jgi:hypothetical protein
MEGSADFVSFLITGGNINARLRSYAIPREHDLWTEFKAAMHGTDVRRWLYNQGSATADRPGDLGYFIGVASLDFICCLLFPSAELRSCQKTP